MIALKTTSGEGSVTTLVLISIVSPCCPFPSVVEIKAYYESDISIFKYFLNYKDIMGSPWKALSDDSRREMLLLLKKRDMIPTEIAEHFNFTLPALSSHLRILKDADLITEKKHGKNRFYSLNRHITLELVDFFEDMYDYNLKSLKEYMEGKRRKTRKRTFDETI